MNGTSPDHDRHHHDERLERVESEVGFVSHTADKLGEQMLSLHRAVDVLAARLARLESRMDALHTPTSHAADAGAGTLADPPGGEAGIPGDAGQGSTDDPRGERPPHWGRTPGHD